MSDREEKLQTIRAYWAAIKDPFGHESVMDITGSMHINTISQFAHLRIFDDLKGLAAPLEDDSTYGLIEDGLTKEVFYKYAAYNAVCHWLKHFHLATHFDGSSTSDSVHAGLKTILRSMKKMQELVSIAGFRDDASPIITRQWDLISQLHQEGVLHAEFKKAANFSARADMHVLQLRYNRLQEKLGRANFYWERHGNNGVEELLSRADSILNKIEEAGEYYAPCQMPYKERRDAEDGRPIHIMAELEYSKEMALKIARDVAVLMCKSDLIYAQEALAAQEFSKRGGGFREDMLHFREILGYLDLARFDLDDEKTYELLGTTKREFLTCYHFQVSANNANPSATGYVGVRLDFPKRFKLEA